MKNRSSDHSQPQDHRIRVAAERRQRMVFQLSEAALRVVGDEGLEGTTIDAIVGEAGVSRGTFYKYFDAPEALIREVGAALADELIMAVNPVLRIHTDPQVRLACGFRTVLALARSYPLLPRFLIHAGWPVTDHVPAFSRNVVANLAAGIDQGRFATSSLIVAQALVGGLTIGMMAALTEPDPAPSLDEQATLALLLALGVSGDEARRISILPVNIPDLPENGLLVRTRARDG